MKGWEGFLTEEEIELLTEALLDLLQSWWRNQQSGPEAAAA